MSPIFRCMDQAALDLAYNNVKAEPDYTTLMERCRLDTLALYEANAVERDIRYGPRDRQRFDWIGSGRPDAATLVFIHGGYWQTYVK